MMMLSARKNLLHGLVLASIYALGILGIIASGGGGSGQQNSTPTASFTAIPTSGDGPLLVNFDASGSSDADGSITSYTWEFGDGATGSGQTTSHTYTVIGGYTAILTVTDDEGAAASTSVTITVTGPLNQAPTASFTANPPTGTAPLLVDFDASGSSDTDGSIVSYAWDFGDGATGSGVTTSNTFSNPGSYTVTLTVTDDVGDTDTTNAAISVSATNQPPPNPSTVAPEINKTVATTLGAATAFLYTGSNPIQTGVAAGTIEPVRVAVLRGKVMQRNGDPIPGVAITILDHPEYGQTLSREDDGQGDGGMFDLAVNGGGNIIVNYSKAGYLPVQRAIDVSWQDYSWLPDVVMIPVDTQVTTIDLTSADPIQVATGSVVTDSDGTRQAVVMIPQGTSAELVMPDGSTQFISTLNIRATEYTVGDNGPETMPAELPPTSGYTYAIELGVDEALAAGATEVRFDQPIYNYVENFLDFPVGGIVPSGYYDRQQGKWIASENGRIIGIVNITASMADLDVDGDGVADTGTALSALGITDVEREKLAGLYTLGQSLWRVPITHFSPWDHNWGFGAGPGDNPPLVPQATNQSTDSPDLDCRSIVECQNQILGERVAIAGTPFTLNYRSNRVPGHLDSYTLEIPLSQDSLSVNLLSIELEIYIAGRKFVDSFAPNLNLTHSFTWDGRDAYGRVLQGSQPIAVRIGYTYRGSYQQTERFGFNGNGTVITGSRTRQEVTLWEEWSGSIGAFDARVQGLGGWTPNVQHIYDPQGRMLYLGDGGRRSANSVSPVVETVAGGRSGGDIGDGGPATAARLTLPLDVAVGPDGSLYIADSTRIRRVGPDGIITTVAGDGNACGSSPTDLKSLPCGDGGLATEAQLGNAFGVAVGPDGSLYIAARSARRVRRVRPDGIITTVAGDGAWAPTSFVGEGGPATEASLSSPHGVAIGSDGNLYISDINFHRVFRVGPDGIINSVAGIGTAGYGGDDGPATEATLYQPAGVAIGPDGNLYIADSFGNRIRRVSTDGIMTTLAGIGGFLPGSGGDGGPATGALLGWPFGIAISADGSLYSTNTYTYQIRRIGPEGVITTVAGTGTQCTNSPCGDGGLATMAQFSSAYGIAIGPEGSLYIADSDIRRIRRVALPLPGFDANDIAIPSEDGSKLYRFDSTGRHLETRHSLTGAVLYSFTYNNEGHLITITDGDGNATSVERDFAGNPTAITAPFGQRTFLGLNAHGYLADITNPASEIHSFTYRDDGGLLATFRDPRNNLSQFFYDPLGRLIRDEDAAGGFITLARTEIENGYEVTKTTAQGRVTTYRVEDLPTGDQRRVNIFPDGTTSEVLTGMDGTTTITYPDGTVTTIVQASDPRWGMLAPILANISTTTPGGITFSQTQSRSVTLTDPDNTLSLASQTDTVATNGRTFNSEYDAANRTISNTSAEGRVTSMVLDSQGRVLESNVSGIDPVLISYDSFGRFDSLTQGAGSDTRTSLFDYGTDGFLQTFTDPLSRTVEYQSNLVGRTTRTILPGNREIEYSYDRNGNITSLTPPGRPAHAFNYTPVDLIEDYTPPDIGIGNTQTSFTYNLDRQIVGIARPDGQTLSQTYDDGRLATLTIPRGQVQFAYDAVTGKLNTITAPDVTVISYTYDGDLLTSTSWSGTVSGSVTRTYNNDFFVQSRSVNSSNTISLIFDNDKLLAQAGAMSLSRNPDNGQLTNTSIGNVTDSWTYNNFGESNAYNAAYSTNTIYSTSYTRDALGRITDKTETIGGATDTYSYTYDTAGRLDEVKKNNVTTDTYIYDSNSNRLSHNAVTGTYDDQDRLIQYGNATYSYTENGELESKTVTTQTTNYNYDVLGNLIDVSLPNGTDIEYVIDGANRRIGKKVNGILVQGFLYKDYLNPIAELDDSNNVVTRFVYGPKANVPAYMIRGGTTYRIISDHLGSPRLVVDITTGTVAQRLDYDAFGQVTNDTNPGFQPFGFAGGLYDFQTGFVRFGARDYDALTGRWTIKDPILFNGGQANLYVYVKNDPINSVDPLGLEEDSFWEYLWDMLQSWGSIPDQPLKCKTVPVDETIPVEAPQYSPRGYLNDIYGENYSPERVEEFLEWMDSPEAKKIQFDIEYDESNKSIIYSWIYGGVKEVVVKPL